MIKKQSAVSTAKSETVASRRKFLKRAAIGTGAAAIGFPMIAKAQAPITLRFQSTWPAKDIFHEYAQDYVRRVNEMGGGRLKLELLPAGAVVGALPFLFMVFLSMFIVYMFPQLAMWLPDYLYSR